MTDRVSRRTLFGGAAGLLSAAAFSGELAGGAPLKARSSAAGTSRLENAYRLRLQAAKAQRDRPPARQQANGDEEQLPD